MTAYTETYADPEAETESSSMSFLEHLDELRTRLIRSAAFVLVAFGVCWFFSDRIYHFLEIPVRAAMLEAQRRGAYQGLNQGVHSKLSDMADGTQVEFQFSTDAKIGEALILSGTTTRAEVRRDEEGTPQLITTVPRVLTEDAVLPEGLVIPRELYSASSLLLSPDNRLVVQTVQGAFNLYIKVSFYAAIFFAVPWILIQVWAFVSPGLYPHEKKYAAPFIVMASVFFLLGCAFAYYIAFPRAATFLLDVAAAGNLRPLVSAGEYFDLIITIMLGLGLVFEIPTVTLFLSRLGLLTPQFLVKGWRIAIVLIFVVAAVLSPTTDIPNLLVFAAPMIVLYLLSIGIAYVFYRKRQRKKTA